ncbi:GNAT family N-acetyltransferase [Streptomyces sp. NPDC020875]|uniref:GNAT family N-acetyltransferase n=1 Tax=Streptomyces sp. NPDC020875 TaxID=3154898 RepID=UPI0033F703C9
MEFRHLDAAGLEAVRHLVLAVHTEVRHQDFGMTGDFHSGARFDLRLSAYAARPGWAAVIGYDDGEPAGFCFGIPLAADTRWWRSMNPPLPAGLVREDGHRTVALNEIVVRKRWRGTGAARRLHDTWLARRTEERVTLLVDPGAGGGRVKTVYESWGYRTLGEQQPFPDSPRFTAMIRPVTPEHPPPSS